MSSAVDILGERVVAAADLIASLRIKVLTLEQELASTHTTIGPPPSQSQTSSPDPSLVEELERLRAERVIARESIRGLLREIDRVSW
jgi:hypothetical protein